MKKDILPNVGSNREGALFLVFLFATLLYLPSVWFNFAYDDAHQIEMNDVVKAPVDSVGSFFDPFFLPTFPGDLYRPITVLSYRLNYMFAELEPLTYHLVNIILYGICCVLVFLLGEAILKRKRPAFAGALLFAAHPAHVEAVANIVGRAELLAAIFGILSIFIFDFARRRRTIIGGFFYLFLSGIIFLLAILSKESAITLLPLILLYRWLPGIRDQHAKKPWMYWFGIIVLLYSIGAALVFRYAVLDTNFISLPSDRFVVENPLLSENLLHRIFPGMVLLGRYLTLMIAPIHLSADYSQEFEDFWSRIFSFDGYIQILLALAFLYGLYKLRKRRFAFFGFWFLCCISIALNIVHPIGTIFAERLAFLPSVGFCLLVPAMARDFGQYGKYKWMSSSLPLLVILGLFTWRTVTRMPVWTDHRSLFTTSVTDAPVSAKSWLSLGIYWYHHEKNPVKAEEAFRKAAELDDHSIAAVKYLVDISLARKDFGRAEFWCLKGLQIDPNDIALGVKLNQLRKLREQIKSRAPGSKDRSRHHSTREAALEGEPVALMTARSKHPLIQ